MQMAGMLVAKVLRSPHPHATVRSIDTSAALALPGVLAVLTPDDLGDWHTFDRGMKDMPLISGYRVPPEEAVVNRTARHFGDAVAAVAAVDEHTAEQALGLLRVEWEELPFVLDAEAAMLPGAPRISDLPEHARNVAKHLDYPFPEGDVDQALATSHLVVRGDVPHPQAGALHPGDRRRHGLGRRRGDGSTSGRSASWPTWRGASWPRSSTSPCARCAY